MASTAEHKARRTRLNFTEDYKMGIVRLVLDEGKPVPAAVHAPLLPEETSQRLPSCVKTSVVPFPSKSPNNRRESRSFLVLKIRQSLLPHAEYIHAVPDDFAPTYGAMSITQISPRSSCQGK